MTNDKQAQQAQQAMRATAEAAKSAGGKLARLGPEGRSNLLRALARALREPGVRTDLAAANAADLQRAKEEGVASPLVKRLGLDAGKLDGVCDGLDQLAAMPDLVGARFEHHAEEAQRRADALEHQPVVELAA